MSIKQSVTISVGAKSKTATIDGSASVTAGASGTFTAAGNLTDSQAGDEAALEAMASSITGLTSLTGWATSGMDLDSTIQGITVHQRNEETRVDEVDLYNLGLSGTLPTEIGNLRPSYINIKLNSLTGEIPATIENWGERMHTMRLSGNDLNDQKDPSTNPLDAYHPGKSDTSGNIFSGEFPDVWASFTSLQYLQLEGSDMTKVIYPSIGNCTELLQLFASWHPNCEQEWPAEIVNCNKMQNFVITRTPWIGTVPDCSSMTDLRFLRAGGGPKWSGDLPDFSNCKLLREIVLNGPTIADSSAGITGSFPTYFGDGTFPDLIGITMDWNKFTGQLPDFSGLQQLRVFGIAGSSMTGNIPDSITQLNNTPNILQFGWNNFDGELPQTGWSDIRINRYLQVTGNNLTGAIPSDLPNSRDFYFHQNSFTEFDGQAFVDLYDQHGRLEILDISDNLIPQDQIDPYIQPLADRGVSFNYGGQEA